jgi:hypothetical protein
MNDRLGLAEDAARLVSYGLRPTLRPSKEPDYAELLQRYRAESPLRELVFAIARGLGLVVLGETELGIVLGAEDAGPFAFRLNDYRVGLSVEARMCHGLVQLAIAAWCFPNARALEDPDSISGTRVSVRGLVEHLIGLCEELKERAEDDPDAGSPELQEAWRTILARAATRGTPDGRRSASTLAGMVAHALESLERGGLMRRISEADALAAHDVAVLVREASATAREGA